MPAVAYFMVHAPRGFFPLLNGGELAIVYCFVFLDFWVAGGGEWTRSIAYARIGIRRIAEPGLSKQLSHASLESFDYVDRHQRRPPAAAVQRGEAHLILAE